MIDLKTRRVSMRGIALSAVLLLIGCAATEYQAEGADESGKIGYIEVGLVAPDDAAGDAVLDPNRWPRAIGWPTSRGRELRIRVLLPLRRFYVAEAGPTTDAYGDLAIYVQFTPESGQELYEFTGEHLKEQFAFLVGGKLMSAPLVVEPVGLGIANFSGFSSEEVRQEVLDSIDG
jgi:hypothetical protein